MDHATLAEVADFIDRHRNLAGFVLGLFVFFESLILVGAFVPATPLLFVAGGLLAAGALDPASVIGWCVVGAALGDAISFRIGQGLGSRALLHPSLAQHRRTIARARLVTRRLGPASIYLGRFLGPMRAFIPAVAGILRMRPRSFQIANVGSAIVWVLVMLSPGYFGAGWIEKLATMEETVIWGALLTVLALAAAAAAWRALRRAPQTRRRRQGQDAA